MSARTPRRAKSTSRTVARTLPASLPTGRESRGCLTVARTVTNPSYEDQAARHHRAVIRVVFGVSGAGSVGTPLARWDSAAEFVCRSSLLVLAVPTSSSVGLRESRTPETGHTAGAEPNHSIRSLLYASLIRSRSVIVVSYDRGSSGPRVLSHT